MQLEPVKDTNYLVPELGYAQVLQDVKGEARV